MFTILSVVLFVPGPIRGTELLFHHFLCIHTLFLSLLSALGVFHLCCSDHLRFLGYDTSFLPRKTTEYDINSSFIALTIKLEKKKKSFKK